MIKEKNVLTVRRGFDRPDPSLVAALDGIMTGNIVDCMAGRGGLDYRVKPLDIERSALCGVAVTAKVAPGDNAALHAALDVARAGDVVICASDGFLETAVIGDLLAGMMKNKGVAGFVTDGLVRDIVGLLPVGLPVFSIGVTPNSPTGTGAGTVGLPIVCGGVAVSSGDVIVGDRDGIVVVPQDQLTGVVDALDEVRRLEQETEAKVKNGATGFGKFEAMVSAGKVVEI